MFTRKHYEKVVKVINRTIPYDDATVRHNTIQEFADMFEDDNPNFDRDRFLKACGFSE